MSMELIIILALQRAPTLDAWQRALDARHIPIQFTYKADLAKHTGFLPVEVNGRRSGFYFSQDQYSDVASTYPAIASAHMAKPAIYSFEYGGNFDECTSVFYAAGVLVSDFGGVAFDPQGGAFMSSQELAETAKECEAMVNKK